MGRNASGVGESLGSHKACETASAVTTLFDFAAIGVENAVAKLRVRLVRGFHEQQLVTADAQTSVSELTDLLRCQVNRLIDSINHYKIISQTVHFAEFQFHALRVRSGRRFASLGLAAQNLHLLAGLMVQVTANNGDIVIVNVETVDSVCSVVTVGEIGLQALAGLLRVYGLTCEQVADTAAIPGSFWGDREAGLLGDRLLVRADTPVHSALHEACHYICMSAFRRLALHTDAGGDYEEENGVCYLQILLADRLAAVGRQRMMQDMDDWGYSFRLGSARAWFEQDAEDARRWLLRHGLIDDKQTPTGMLRFA
jgi:hypothetical protein